MPPARTASQNMAEQSLDIRIDLLTTRRVMSELYLALYLTLAIYMTILVFLCMKERNGRGALLSMILLFLNIWLVLTEL